MGNTVSVRDLRNHGGDVLKRVEDGQTLTVTSSGRPVAQLSPLPPRAPGPQELVARFAALPPMSLEDLRSDLDGLWDPSL
jgi:prevent-host-death family protein